MKQGWVIFFSCGASAGPRGTFIGRIDPALLINMQHQLIDMDRKKFTNKRFLLHSFQVMNLGLPLCEY